MVQLNQVYKCNVCGNMVEIVHASVGQLVCCNEPMELLEEITEDKGLEKHVPVIEETENGILVKIGSVDHPMEEDHYIEWIEVITNGQVYRKFLSPNDEPKAEFNVPIEGAEARAYCNIHGLWKS
ncbi:desulfoferrodoxin [Candidatus Dojkabacteria bacterium]|nr:desulfoferrodoxin [Candidatus Dojkabacteria bacterium]